MNRERRRDVLEGLGLLAVVGSLIFLALEIRHNTLVVSGQSINEIYDAVREIDLIAFADPALTRITNLTRADLPSVNDADRAQYEQYIILMLEVWERAIARENEGLIDSEAVASWHMYYADFVHRHLTADVWEEIRWNWKNPELHERVDAALVGQPPVTD
jgi:hypothetical protein